MNIPLSLIVAEWSVVDQEAMDQELTMLIYQNFHQTEAGAYDALVTAYKNSSLPSTKGPSPLAKWTKHQNLCPNVQKSVYCTLSDTQTLMEIKHITLLP